MDFVLHHFRWKHIWRWSFFNIQNLSFKSFKKWNKHVFAHLRCWDALTVQQVAACPCSAAGGRISRWSSLMSFDSPCLSATWETPRRSHLRPQQEDETNKTWDVWWQLMITNNNCSGVRFVLQPHLLTSYNFCSDTFIKHYKLQVWTFHWLQIFFAFWDIRHVTQMSRVLINSKLVRKGYYNKLYFYYTQLLNVKAKNHNIYKKKTNKTR